MITSATFENSKWYEPFLDKTTFLETNAPEKELAFFQRIIFEEAGYQVLNDQGKLNPSVFVNHLRIDKTNDLEQILFVDVSINSKVSTIGYKIIQKRNSTTDQTATTEIKILTPNGVKQQIDRSFETDGPLSPINY